jgi:hypothetical protein
MAPLKEILSNLTEEKVNKTSTTEKIKFSAKKENGITRSTKNLENAFSTLSSCSAST